MNLRKIIEMQRELDKSIELAHNVKPEEILKKRIVALLVEIGEFANEYAPFKYWKKNKNIDRLKVVEEFVDGIHFLSSLFIYLKLDDFNIKSIIISDDMTLQLGETFNAVSKLVNEINEETLRYAFGVYLGNARLLEISNEEIEKSYVEKNKINFERIKNNY